MCIFVGWAARRNGWLSDKRISIFNHYVIWVCLPAIALHKLPLLDIEWSLLFPAIMTWTLIPILIVLVLLLARGYGWNRNIVGCVLLLVCFGNTSFVGFPIIQAFFGKDALAYAVIYDQLGSFLGLAIVGNIIIACYAQPESSEPALSLRHLVIKVLTFPPFVAMLFAFITKGWYLTPLVKQGLSIISITLVPATMILVGAHFNLKVAAHHRTPLIWALGVKMLIAPLLAFAILKLTQQQALSAQVTLMEAAMPPMVTASILAIKAKLAPQLAAVGVGYGIILAIIIMPLVKHLSYFL